MAWVASCCHSLHSLHMHCRRPHGTTSLYTKTLMWKFIIGTGKSVDRRWGSCCIFCEGKKKITGHERVKNRILFFNCKSLLFILQDIESTHMSCNRLWLIIFIKIWNRNFKHEFQWRAHRLPGPCSSSSHWKPGKYLFLFFHWNILQCHKKFPRNRIDSIFFPWRPTKLICESIQTGKVSHLFWSCMRWFCEHRFCWSEILQ